MRYRRVCPQRRAGSRPPQVAPSGGGWGRGGAQAEAADAGRVRCHLSPGQMVATLKASSHVGTATEQLVSSCRGEPLDIGFGAPLLADMLSSLPQGATLEVLLQGTTGPAGMRCADVPGWQFVLCPMIDV